MNNRILVLCFVAFLSVQCAGSLQKGDTYMSQQNYEGAIEEYKSLVSYDPNNHTAYLKLGDAYLGINEFNLALQAFTEALRLKPDWAEVKSRMPKVRLQQGQDLEKKGFEKEALAEYESLKRSNPDFLPVYEILVAIYEKNGDTSNVLQAYEVLAQQDNRSELSNIAVEKVSFLTTRAQELLESARSDYDAGMFYESSENYKQYLTIKSEDREARYLQHIAEGKYHFSLGTATAMSAAIESFNNAVNVRPDDPVSYYFLAQAHEQHEKRDYSNSIAYYLKVLELAPGTELGKESEIKINKLKEKQEVLERFFKKK